MACIFPFHALHYDPSKVAPAAVLTQPYDKISPAMQDRYYAASPYNLVRVILGKPAPGDDDYSNVYTRAVAALQKWRAEGVLLRDAEPSIYRYVESFRTPGDSSGQVIERRSFIALGQLEDYDRNVIFRHELTLSKPKADRLNLLRATQAQCEQIFMLYSDPPDEIDRALRQNSPPTLEVRDEYGVLHQLWRISDPAVIKSLQARMADKKLVIADGHHRYETALNYRNEMRQQVSGNGSRPFDRMVMTFVNMDAPGLVILPTHRVAFGLENFSIFEMVAKLSENFEVKELGPPSAFAVALERLHRAGHDGTSFLAATSHAIFLLRLRPGSNPKSLAGLSPQQCGLDVVQLHKLVLEDALGMSEGDIRNQKHLKYVREAGEALEEVSKGANVAFILNPVRIEQMRDIAFAGEVMPQKSTDFYPKLLSGLTIYSLEEATETASGGN